MAIRKSFLVAAGLVLAASLGVGGTVEAAAAAARDGAVAATHARHVHVHPRRAHAGARARIATRVAVMRDPALATIASLRAIERIHRRNGHADAVPGYLRGVLARTSDATVRNYVTFRLARIELRDRDVPGALRALERGVDENLRRLR